MKNISIRLKITLWFSIILILVVTLTYFAILSVSDQVIQKTIRDNLIETVEYNVTEIGYYNTIDHIDLGDGSTGSFLQYEGGFLEVDANFLDQVNQVYTALYQSDGTFIYGENPIARETQDYAFSDSTIQRVTVDGTLYYIFDRELSQDGLEGLWLRGVVSEEQGRVQMSSISRTSLVLLPALVLVAIIGGYLLACRSLRPIHQISENADQIRQGGDLKRRIEIGEGRDEVHQLADSFNHMFQRLDDSFQSDRQFISDASHELRTPMSVIMAECELSLEQEMTTEEYVEALEVIQRQGQKMSRLITEMLDYTRVEQRSDRYKREPLDLTAMVESLCADMALIRQNGIALTWDAQPGVTFVGNTELLSRLLSNLISNAYRYGRSDGHIFVSLKAEGGSILLSVQDDGIGIAPEEQEKIFRRFYQADNSRSGEGTGLGLAMVREIARFHGGEVTVESTLDVGSTFTLTLPSAPGLPTPT